MGVVGHFMVEKNMHFSLMGWKTTKLEQACQIKSEMLLLFGVFNCQSHRMLVRDLLERPLNG